MRFLVFLLIFVQMRLVHGEEDMLTTSTNIVLYTTKSPFSETTNNFKKHNYFKKAQGKQHKGSIQTSKSKEKDQKELQEQSLIEFIQELENDIYLRNQIYEFIRINKKNLLKEIAKGQGEALDTLLSLLNCEPEFVKALKYAFQPINNDSLCFSYDDEFGNDVTGRPVVRELIRFDCATEKRGCDFNFFNNEIKFQKFDRIKNICSRSVFDLTTEDHLGPYVKYYSDLFNRKKFYELLKVPFSNSYENYVKANERLSPADRDEISKKIEFDVNNREFYINDEIKKTHEIFKENYLAVNVLALSNATFKSNNQICKKFLSPKAEILSVHLKNRNSFRDKDGMPYYFDYVQSCINSLWLWNKCS